MRGFGVVGPTSASHLDWCRGIWAMISDGGVWAVPRSGLVFRKDEQARTWTLVERMPWLEEMGEAARSGADVPPTAEDLRIYQDEDIEAIRQRFASIGIEVLG